MLLLIPIRTDSPVRRLPRVNHVLIALNVVVYLTTNVFARQAAAILHMDLKRQLVLSLADPQILSFLTYQFLHADVWHLLGNMLFLWVFGNSVNSKMGNPAYLMFYLAGGVFAAAGFALFSDGNLIGASGAIAAVTTAYLVLFPRSEVTVFYWLFLFIGTMHMQALMLIGLKIILWDNVLSPSLSEHPEMQSVAYSAHLAGYVFGFVVCALLLVIRALPRDQYDIVALYRRYRQRQQLRSALSDPKARARSELGTVARAVDSTGRPIEPGDEQIDDDLARIRSEIAELIANSDYAAAVERYQELVARDPEQCLPRKNMLAVANQLMTMQRHPQAAAAYERFLKAYPTDSDAAQVKLLLGIIYARYLRRYEAAQKYLRECLARLTDPAQIEQAQHWLQVASPAGPQSPWTPQG